MGTLKTANSLRHALRSHPRVMFHSTPPSPPPRALPHMSCSIPCLPASLPPCLRANLSRTADEVALYYLKHFLPLCVELCRPDSVASGASSTKPASSSSPSSPTTPDAHNPQASVESATAAGSTPGAAGGAGAGAADLSFFPDPTRDISEHSPVARGVAYIFLKRQQVILQGECTHLLLASVV